MSKRLILLGGGHAHIQVLKAFAENPPADCELTLISPYPTLVYSGMLPGWVAGHYTIEQCAIPLDALAAAASAAFHETAATRIDFTTQTVICENGKALPFDVLSIDTGSVADLSAIEGATDHAVSLRPVQRFVDAFKIMKGWMPARARTRIAIVGAGVGGIEIAMAMQHAFRKQDVGVTLISGADTLPGTAGPRVVRALRKRGLNIMAGQVAVAIGAREVHLASGGVVDADFVFASVGASAPAWPRASGLFVDADGFVLTNDRLQSVSHGNVFAAGDCASIEHFPRPRSGVYAVRAGPPLTENLRRYLRGEALTAYRPQVRSLYLISAGNRYAVASWGRFSWEGWWVWWWKNWIDRGFVRRFLKVRRKAEV